MPDVVVMSADREGDGMVARYVMGWTLVEYPSGDDHWRTLDGLQVSVAYWKPTTDLTDAWKVVEYVRSIGFVVKTESWPEAWNWAYVGREDQGALEEAGHPDSMPYAICKAALSAMLRFRAGDYDSL